jgi:uncharacterized OB-fold protein
VPDDNLTVDSFYDQGTKGRLVGLQCESKHVTVPPRHSCSVCGSQDLHKIDLSGRGEVISFTEVFVKSREFPVNVPYVLAIVTLEEGGKLIGVVRAGNSNLEHGAKVMVEFRKLNEKEWPRIFFRLT